MMTSNTKKKKSRWEADNKCVSLKRAAEMLVLLRTPKTRKQIETQMGISRGSAIRWLRSMREVIPMKMNTQYGPDGCYGKRVVTYCWDQALMPEISHYTALRSLDGCLFCLGATEKEIMEAKKNDMTTMDYKGWVNQMFRKCLKDHPPSESSPGTVRMWIQAHDRANHILDWREH